MDDPDRVACADVAAMPARQRPAVRTVRFMTLLLQICGGL